MDENICDLLNLKVCRLRSKHNKKITLDKKENGLHQELDEVAKSLHRNLLKSFILLNRNVIVEW